jgi:calcineurin-like phosphoesterase
MKIAFYGDVVGEIGINGVKNNIIGQSMTNEQWCELCDKWQPLF